MQISEERLESQNCPLNLFGPKKKDYTPTTLVVTVDDDSVLIGEGNYLNVAYGD